MNAIRGTVEIRKQRKFKKKTLDISALQNAETAELFAQEVTKKFANDEQQRSTADTSSNIVNTLHAAAEMWRNGGEFNTLLKQRILSRKDGAEYTLDKTYKKAS